jgi:uncharacterized protein YjcR
MSENPTHTGVKNHPPALRLACRREYIHGEGTLPQIAAKYELKPSTVHRWSIAEGWGRLRASWIEQQKRKDENTTSPLQF